MKISTGIDIVKISRLKEAIQRWNDKFLNRVFTDKELAYAKNRAFLPQTLAARFAAKEAIIKALGDRKLNYNEIQITNSKSGQPQVEILGKHLDCQVSISISHTEEYAVACAVILK